MAITKTVILTDLSAERNNLVLEIERKRIAGLIKNTNVRFHRTLYTITPEIELLITKIEEKIRKAEVLYHTHLADIDPQIINGSRIGLPFEMQATYTFGTTVFKNEISINEPSYYTEVVEMSFQTFILTIASIYENIVRLVELLIKKVVIHIIGKPPQTSPLHNYVEFIESLLHLEYRSIDPFTACIYRYKTYFDEYLVTINELRNSFIHGFKSNLAIISGDYKITKFESSSFNQSSPKLNVDVFSSEILTKTAGFTNDLLLTLASEVAANTVGIPI